MKLVKDCGALHNCRRCSLACRRRRLEWIALNGRPEISSGGEWSPRSRTGCDIMGLYSQLGSLCSMLATLQVGVITYRMAHNK